ncbi:HAUS augmin-like complex subunit 2 [Odontesthes bonariensis]|uniref:HAUS augmin-like complex subunit 2 n=1 Tax=Odontesthes bonariensis TaxID=219752 RepID=UPI003F584BE9
MMHQWDLSLFSVTPAARLLSRCVSVGAACQEEIDSALSDINPSFSAHLEEAVERISMQKQLDEFQLQLELLKVDEQSADIGHVFHLARKNEKLQMLGGHLMGLLREQKRLRLRLMRPLAHTNLPVLAHMHRFVVNSIRLMMDFIESLEEKLRSAHNRSTTTTDGLVLLDTSQVLLLSLAAEWETLSNKILEWRTVSSSQVTSEPRPHPPAGQAVCGL